MTIAETPKRFDAVTAVVVADHRPFPAETLAALEDALSRFADDHEVVVVANGVTPQGAQALVRLAETVPNVTVHFLAERIDRDTAILVGLDHALGDWVVVLSPSHEEIAALPQVLAQAGAFEVVFAGAREKAGIPAGYRGVAGLYFRLYELTTGATIDWPAPRIRVYSRSAARYLTTLLDGEFALRQLQFSGAFPGTRETVAGLPSSDLELPRTSRALRKAFRGLLNASAVPLRVVVGTALLTGAIALVSSLYAILVWLFYDDVEPGWTTLSLQLSVMMFLFSAMFALLAEYVLNVYRAIAPRRRIAVVREVRSPIRRQSERLNVVGADGAFHLGAPPLQPASAEGPSA